MISITFEDKQQADFLVDHLGSIAPQPKTMSAITTDMANWRWQAGLNAPTLTWRKVWSAVSVQLIEEVFMARSRSCWPNPADLQETMEQFAARLHPAVAAELKVRKTGADRGSAEIMSVLDYDPTHLEVAETW
jgi:hypothetical protein